MKTETAAVPPPEALAGPDPSDDPWGHSVLGDTVPRAVPLPFAWKRWTLYALLGVLVVAMLVVMVWLAGRNEIAQVQSRVERDAFDAAADIRAGLVRNTQSLRALGQGNLQGWQEAAEHLLRERREMMRIEWRDADLHLGPHADTPYQAVRLDSLTQREGRHSDLSLACANARRFSGAAYSASYFVPRPGGQGMEVVEMCLPYGGTSSAQPEGYVVAVYSLQEVLANLANPQLTRGQELLFTESDGTRLATHGQPRRGTRMFTAQQVLDLPGNTLLLRMDSWHGAPSLFPNVLTALVTAMSIALVSVLVLLAKDNRRRLVAEANLADALAFRKAMEDSLITGLRARDLQGRITYVNPAFCQMVGYGVEELVGRMAPMPYWPPELSAEYQMRQDIRLTGTAPPPPREGYESVFQRKDGARFPVLIFEAPLINAQGAHTGWMSAFIDLSEQRRMEEMSRTSHERLQATARLATVGEMASLISHELNQPLAAISSYATGSMNLLRYGGADAPVADLEMAMRRIAEQAERAGKVIRSVYDFVRRRDQARELVAPASLVDAILPLLNLQARKLHIDVQVRMPPGLPKVVCDRTMVEQVLLNLARNGMQAMDRPGAHARRLLIAVERTGSGADGDTWLEFRVTDFGTGIPEEVARQLYTPFFTTKSEGMGLGLSMCRTVAEQHGGELQFMSNQPHGTIFTFKLPVKRTVSHGTYA